MYFERVPCMARVCSSLRGDRPSSSESTIINDYVTSQDFSLTSSSDLNVSMTSFHSSDISLELREEPLNPVLNGNEKSSVENGNAALNGGTSRSDSDCCAAPCENGHTSNDTSSLRHSDPAQAGIRCLICMVRL